MKKTLLLATAIVMASPTAFAQSSLQRFYLGGGGGISNITNNMDAVILPVAGATASSVTYDKTSNPVRAFAGFRFTPNWGIEVGAQSVGQFDARRVVTAPAATTTDASWTVRGGYADLVLSVPFGDDTWSVNGKVGAMRATTRMESTTAGVTTTSTGNKFAFRYGVGLQFSLNRWPAFRADAEVNKGATNSNLGGLSTDPLEYNVFTGSFLVKF